MNGSVPEILQEASENPFLKAALDYASIGKAVFALTPFTKIPHPSLAPHGFLDATTDRELIRRWWTICPNANVGIATGAKSGGLFVVDCDVKPDANPPKDGIWELDRIVAESGGGALPAAFQRTPSGGIHYPFHFPGGKNSVDRLAHGIDTRGDGGYIAVYPSKFRGEDGIVRSYELITPLCDGPLTPLPQWAVDKLAAPKAKAVESHPPLDTRKTYLSPNDNLANRKKYMEKLDPAIQGQGGGDNTFQYACECFRWGMSDAEAWVKLCEFNATKCHPMWSEKKLRHKFDDAKERVKNDGQFGCRNRPLPDKSKGANYDGWAASPAVKVAIEPYQPFPVELLPDAVRDFVKQIAKTVGCDESFGALPILCALASAIGNSRKIMLKKGWSECAALWAAVVALSGGSKTPAFIKALQYVFERQAAVWAVYTINVKKYEADMAEYKIARNKGQEVEPPKPPAECRHYYVGDTTVEALAVRLESNPAGLLLAVDELSGWFAGHNQYKKGGSDVQSYLSMHGAGGVKIDRKTSIPPTIIVPRAFVAICGGVQPKILAGSLTDENFSNGLAARFLFAMPPERDIVWTDAEDDDAINARVGTLFDALWKLEMANDLTGIHPLDLPLSPPAKVAWVEFYNRHGGEQGDFRDDRLKAAWAKLRATAARLALIFYCIESVTNGGLANGEIDCQSMMSGIALADWFGNEAKRVYAMLAGADGADGGADALVDWIKANGGSTTTRELMQHNRRKYVDSASAEATLNALESKGVGQWGELATTEAGGRPTRRFQLTPIS